MSARKDISPKSDKNSLFLKLAESIIIVGLYRLGIKAK
jgi:hypothetical protein